MISKIIFVVTFIASTAGTAYLAHEVNTLNEKLRVLAEIAKDQDEMIIAQQKHTEAVRDYSTSKIHSVQDSLEERIGTLERKIENIEFVFGEMSKKQRKHK